MCNDGIGTSVCLCVSVHRERRAQPWTGWLGEEYKPGDSRGAGAGTPQPDQRDVSTAHIIHTY